MKVLSLKTTNNKRNPMKLYKTSKLLILHIKQNWVQNPSAIILHQINVRKLKVGLKKERHCEIL